MKEPKRQIRGLRYKRVTINKCKVMNAIITFSILALMLVSIIVKALVLINEAKVMKRKQNLV